MKPVAPRGFARRGDSIVSRGLPFAQFHQTQVRSELRERSELRAQSLLDRFRTKAAVGLSTLPLAASLMGAEVEKVTPAKPAAEAKEPKADGKVSAELQWAILKEFGVDTATFQTNMYEVESSGKKASVEAAKRLIEKTAELFMEKMKRLFSKTCG